MGLLYRKLTRPHHQPEKLIRQTPKTDMEIRAHSGELPTIFHRQEGALFGSLPGTEGWVRIDAYLRSELEKAGLVPPQLKLTSTRKDRRHSTRVETVDVVPFDLLWSDVRDCSLHYQVFIESIQSGKNRRTFDRELKERHKQHLSAQKRRHR